MLFSNRKTWIVIAFFHSYQATLDEEPVPTKKVAGKNKKTANGPMLA